MIRENAKIKLFLQGGYEESAHWVWCGSPILGDDGGWHLFASRWSMEFDFHPGWLFHSEIVRAVAERPEGPYRYEKTVLGHRDPVFFDGRCCHNPCVRRHGNLFLLFYMGSTYPEAPPAKGEVEPFSPRYLEAWGRKRIGLAVAESVRGPWKRADAPLMEPRPGHWDAIATTNPAPWIEPDGSGLMIYKSRTVFGGPRLLGVARAAHWSGPWIQQREEPLFEGHDLEDPCLWKEGGVYHMVLKDMTGETGGEAGCLVKARSADGLRWELEDPPFFHGKTLHWEDGSETRAGNFERPQVLIVPGSERPALLFAAISNGPSGIGDATRTRNVCAALPGGDISKG